MEFKYKIQLKNSCQQDWNAMKSSASGSFCANCNKNVFYFTKLSDKEIIRCRSAFPDDICGRFRQSQLNREITIKQSGKLYGRYSNFFAGLVFFSLTSNGAGTNNTSKFINPNEIDESKSKTKKENKKNMDRVPLDSSSCTISGRILDSIDQLGLASAVITIKGKYISTISGRDGEYTLAIPPDMQTDTITLSISCVGFDEVIFSVSRNELPLTRDISLSTSTFALQEIIYLGYGKFTKIKKWWQFWK